MAIPDVMQTGRSGLVASKIGISVAGHNIANVETEGYSRQRLIHAVADPLGLPHEKHRLGTGTKVVRVERSNHAYLEKQICSIERELSFCQEKDMAFKQIEDIFNELNDDGLNRLISRFFNEFRQLANEPESMAIRQSVKEASQSMMNDFKRLRREVEEVRGHLDSKIEGLVSECNATLVQIAQLNEQIKTVENQGVASPNDLLDRRDLLLKKLSGFMDVVVHPDEGGVWNIDSREAGPLVSHFQAEQFSLNRTEKDEEGKADNHFDVFLSHHQAPLTHLLKSGKLGALFEVRDQVVSSLLERLDILAFSLIENVNQVHRQGFSLEGQTGLAFFKELPGLGSQGAAGRMDFSEDLKRSVNAIAAAWVPDAPGDNRVALALSQLQFESFMNEGKATADEWYNSIISDVGVFASKNRFSLVQQEDVMNQLTMVKEQISGVSLDEETTRLLEFQHLFDACSQLIRMADAMVKTVLALKQ